MEQGDRFIRVVDLVPVKIDRWELSYVPFLFLGLFDKGGGFIWVLLRKGENNEESLGRVHANQEEVVVKLFKGGQFVRLYAGPVHVGKGEEVCEEGKVPVSRRHRVYASLFLAHLGGRVHAPKGKGAIRARATQDVAHHLARGLFVRERWDSGHVDSALLFQVFKGRLTASALAALRQGEAPVQGGTMFRPTLDRRRRIRRVQNAKIVAKGVREKDLGVTLGIEARGGEEGSVCHNVLGDVTIINSQSEGNATRQLAQKVAGPRTSVPGQASLLFFRTDQRVGINARKEALVRDNAAACEGTQAVRRGGARCAQERQETKGPREPKAKRDHVRGGAVPVFRAGKVAQEQEGA